MSDFWNPAVGQYVDSSAMAPFQNFFAVRDAYQNAGGNYGANGYMAPIYGGDSNSAIVGYRYNGPQNLAGAFSGDQINYDALPKPVAGTLSNLVPWTNALKLVNPNMVWNDPNYGRVTVAQNVVDKQNPIESMIAMAAGTGMQMLGMPGWAIAIPRLASSISGMIDARQAGNGQQTGIGGSSMRGNNMQNLAALLLMLAAGRGRGGP